MIGENGRASELSAPLQHGLTIAALLLGRVDAMANTPIARGLALVVSVVDAAAPLDGPKRAVMTVDAERSAGHMVGPGYTATLVQVSTLVAGLRACGETEHADAIARTFGGPGLVVVAYDANTGNVHAARARVLDLTSRGDA